MKVWITLLGFAESMPAWPPSKSADGALAGERIEQVKAGPDHPAWSDFDRALLRAADELHDDSCISDATWAELRAAYDMFVSIGWANLSPSQAISCRSGDQ